MKSPLKRLGPWLVRKGYWCRVFKHEWWTIVPFDLDTIYCVVCGKHL